MTTQRTRKGSERTLGQILMTEKERWEETNGRRLSYGELEREVISRYHLSTTDETIRSSQNGFAGDAAATSGAIGSEFQAVADAIGRVKVAYSVGDTPDYSEIINATSALPSCG